MIVIGIHSRTWHQNETYAQGHYARRQAEEQYLFWQHAYAWIQEPQKVTQQKCQAERAEYDLKSPHVAKTVSPKSDKHDEDNKKPGQTKDCASTKLEQQGD